MHIIDTTDYLRYQVRVTKITEMATETSPTPSPETAVSEFAGQLFFRLWRASHVRAADVLESVGLTPALFGLRNVIGALLDLLELDESSVGRTRR